MSDHSPAYGRTAAGPALSPTPSSLRDGPPGGAAPRPDGRGPADDDGAGSQGPRRDARGHHVDLLIVEDSPTDLMFTQAALKEAGFTGRLHVARDGAEALSFLQRHPGFESAPRPRLILLDLHLPRMDGRTLLAQLKADPGLRRIPVVVMSSSDRREDVEACYDHYANGFVTKPLELHVFKDVMRAIERFWLHAAQLPEGSDDRL